MESRVFPHEMELNVVNLLNFTLSQLNLRKRVMWFIHFCQNVACLQEAQRQSSVQMAMIDQKIRSIQHHLLWSDSQYSFLLMDRLRSWMKERRFYRELTYAVLNSISTLFRLEGHSLYPDGIRPIEEWYGYIFHWQHSYSIELIKITYLTVWLISLFQMLSFLKISCHWCTSLVFKYSFDYDSFRILDLHNSWKLLDSQVISDLLKQLISHQLHWSLRWICWDSWAVNVFLSFVYPNTTNFAIFSRNRKHTDYTTEANFLFDVDMWRNWELMSFFSNSLDCIVCGMKWGLTHFLKSPVEQIQYLPCHLVMIKKTRDFVRMRANWWTFRFLTIAEVGIRVSELTQAM